MLVPASADTKPTVPDVLRKMRELRQGVRLGPGLTVRQLIEEGRRL
jgi:hypothetical protein